VLHPHINIELLLQSITHSPIYFVYAADDVFSVSICGFAFSRLAPLEFDVVFPMKVVAQGRERRAHTLGHSDACAKRPKGVLQSNESEHKVSYSCRML
jgi:hypothetical protein